MLECAVAAGVCSAGGDVLRAGVLPTPAVAYCTREMNADAGVVISASHNPFQDNGIKIFSGDGFKLSDAEEDRIEELISGSLAEPPAGHGLGTVAEFEKAMDRYVTLLSRHLSRHRPGGIPSGLGLRERGHLPGGACRSLGIGCAGVGTGRPA